MFHQDVILFFLQFLRPFPENGLRASDPQKPTIPGQSRSKSPGKYRVPGNHPISERQEFRVSRGRFQFAT